LQNYSYSIDKFKNNTTTKKNENKIRLVVKRKVITGELYLTQLRKFG